MEREQNHKHNVKTLLRDLWLNQVTLKVQVGAPRTHLNFLQLDPLAETHF